MTLSLPKDPLRRLRILAGRRDTSMSALLADSLEQLVAREDEDEAALARLVARVERGLDLGTDGRIGVARDELHER